MNIIRSLKHLKFSEVNSGDPFTTPYTGFYIKLDKEYGICSPTDYVSKVNAIDISTGKLYQFDKNDTVYPINGSFVENYNQVVI